MKVTKKHQRLDASGAPGRRIRARKGGNRPPIKVKALPAPQTPNALSLPGIG